MADWIRASQPDYISMIHHSDTEIPFLAHVKKVFAIAPKLEEHFAPDRMRCANECVCHVNSLRVWRAFLDNFVLSNVDVWNSHRADAWVLELCQRLLDSAR